MPATPTPEPSAPSSAPSAPAASAPVELRIEAEDYDSGGEGVGYSTGRGDYGNATPRSDAMDIGSDPNASGGYSIGWTAAGQWFAYTVDVATSGVYKLGFVSQMPWSDSQLHATIDGADTTGNVTMPVSSDKSFEPVWSRPFDLAAGKHKIVVTFDNSGVNLDAIDLQPTTEPLPTAAPATAAPAPAAASTNTVAMHGHTYTFNPAMSDEFNGGKLDTSKWQSTYNNNTQRLNDEWECYTDNNTRVATASTLQLVGRKVGAKHEAGGCGAPNYESGMIRSTAKQKYGYFEASMKMPGGAGMWPAFWLIPGATSANNFSAPWPPEIDIMEMVNNGREGPLQITQFMHGCGSELDNSLVSSWGDYPTTGSMNFADGKYHQFATEWTPTTVYMYVDGKQARSYNFVWDSKPPSGKYGLEDPSTCSKADSGPADVILNLALGGNWPGDIDDAALPQTMEIDYVRVYSY